MSTIWLSEREAQALEIIEDRDFSNIVSLVTEIGYNRQTFFIAKRCAGLDFRGSDITDVSFANADLNVATFFRDQFRIALSTEPRRYDVVILHLRDEFATSGEKEDEAETDKSVGEGDEISRANRRAMVRWAKNESKKVSFLGWPQK